MGQKSLFFNAMLIDDDYDRKYNADDISDWFSIVCTTGVLKGGLQASVGTGLTVNVSVGKATIKGKGYVNTATLNISVGNAPTGANPYYVPIKLQYNNEQTASGRYIEIVAGDPLTTIPTISNLTQTDTIWELMLGYAIIQPNASVVSQVVDTRGQDVCPWFTAVKGYDDYYDAIIQQFEYDVTLQASSTTVITNLAANLYNDKYSLVEVYVNGLREEEDNYTVGTNSSYITITFTSLKNAGADISVILNNFIDGEGLPTALEEYTQWAQDVADLKAANSYTYVCNGLNDNVNITNLVNTFRNGGNDNGSLELKIVGNFGCKNGTQYVVPVGGSGTSASPYKIFDFVSGSRRVVLDFYNCSEINVPISGVYGIIFNVQGTGVVFKGLNVVTSGSASGTCIRAFNSTGGIITCEDCRFWINAYLNSFISNNGVFKNCRGSVSNSTNNSYCFQPTSLVELDGGEYYAYTGQSNKQSAIVGQSTADAVSILYGVNVPVVARAGFYQTNSILQWSGGGQVRCRDMITTLADVIASGVVENTIAINKPSTL